MKNIVVGIDGGLTSKIAARQAVDIALAMGAHVHFVTTVRKREVQEVRSGSDHWLVDNVDSAREHVGAWLVSEKIEVQHSIAAMTGPPKHALVDEARRLDADLIVVGNADSEGIGRLTGSVGTDVSHRAPCSLLIVKTV